MMDCLDDEFDYSNSGRKNVFVKTTICGELVRLFDWHSDFQIFLNVRLCRKIV